jgi:general secretion pathway protein H
MSARGFTLMEVVVVLLVLGIAAGAAVPAFRGAGAETPVDASTREVLTLLRSARRLAVDRTTSVTLMLEPATGRYWVSTTASDSLRADSLSLPPGTRLVAAAPRVRFAFERDGSASGEPIAVEGEGRRVPILLDRWSGDVRAAR